MYIKQIELLNNTNNERRVGENENQFLPITTCLKIKIENQQLINQ